MKLSPARTAAFDILMRVEKGGSFSSILLPKFEDILPPKDRSLCHEITLGVLRRKLYLDAIIDRLSDERRIDPEVRCALRLGLFQLIFLDRVPPHAAIDESVDLVVRSKKRSAKGFVNAILRAFQRNPFVPRSDDPIELLCISTSHPRWLIERWMREFGLDETYKLCAANNDQPPIVFRNVGTSENIAANLSNGLRTGAYRNSEIAGGAFVAAEFSLELRKLSRDGSVYLQDEGSQLVAQAVIQEGGKLIFDVCAAPGGKTTMIAGGRDVRVVAGDVRSSRVRQLAETCRNQVCESIDLVQYDATRSLPFNDASFDIVFVDAPCSGTGTIRHNPEIRYSVSETDIMELSRKQLLIIKNASELVRVGGKLIYSTCSLEQEENEGVCDAFSRNNPNFIKTRPGVSEQFLTERGFARTFPQRDDMDGFFIAVFQRR